jgi:polysaccharide export outer membrane protein
MAFLINSMALRMRYFAGGAVLFAFIGLSSAQAPQSISSAPPQAGAASAKPTASMQDYVLGSGDVIKISVFQNPDLTVETRVSENGTITFPLIGAVVVGGTSTSTTEKHIARMLKEGNFLIDPQVTVLIEQIHGNQVAALGQFNRPGRYPLETTQMKLSDLIATAGGIAPTGSDKVIFTGIRDGKSVWQEIDIGTMYANNHAENDFVLKSGDVLFVDRFPLFYIYGAVQRPGSYRVERNMTMVQALAAGGGLTPRGTQRGMRIKRKDSKGKTIEINPEIDDPVLPDDVIFVRESIF